MGKFIKLYVNAVPSYHPSQAKARAHTKQQNATSSLQALLISYYIPNMYFHASASTSPRSPPPVYEIASVGLDHLYTNQAQTPTQLRAVEWQKRMTSNGTTPLG